MSPARSGNIDQISRALGKLEAEAEIARVQRVETGRRLDLVDGKVDALHEQNGEILGLMKAMEERLAAIEPDIKDYRRLKQRAVGMAMLWAGLSAAGATLLSHWKTVTGWFK